MPTTSRDKTTYDFGYGDAFSFQLLEAGDIEKAKPKPGLYGWYYRLPRRGHTPTRCEAYASLFMAKRLNVHASSHLAEKYEGIIRRTSPDIQRDLNADTATLAAVSAVLSPPLYIGISGTLRQRLLQHRQCLHNSLSHRREPTQYPEIQADTELESTHFGQRIAFWLQQQSVNNSY